MTESVKELEPPSHDEEATMPKAAPVAASSIILVPVLIVLLVGTVLFVPLSPSISATFTIKTVPGRVEISIVTASYSRETLIKGFSAGATGSILLSVRPAQLGAYQLSIQVTYGTGNPLLATFEKIGDGSYGFKVLYAWQQESAGIPYSLTVSVSGQNIQTASFTFEVYPS
jgi:hypothetical protein